jgi:hypothetical protein
MISVPEEHEIEVQVLEGYVLSYFRRLYIYIGMASCKYFIVIYMYFRIVFNSLWKY